VHTVGGVVRPGERLLDIVPTGQALVIQAQVRPEDADDLHVGQRAEVRITAFSGRDMPIMFGTVREVSADRFTDEHTGRAYFLAQVEAPTAEVSRLRRDAKSPGPKLSAGLPAEMIAVTRKRTALQYLLEPLNQAMWRSFREG
jgi:HlyD family secretion protein